MNLSQIDTNRIEGRLLIAALSALTVSPSINLNGKEMNGRQMQPDEVLAEVVEVADFIYKDNPLPPTQMAEATTFSKQIETLINKASKENDNDTPDYILAEYLNNCLDNYSKAVKQRDKWFGVSMWDKSATEAKWNS